jgi:heme oxygenase
MAIVDGCPAFSEGCPFSKLLTAGEDAVTIIPEVLASLPKEIADKCPAFKNGCPFKEEASVEELYNHMAEMPATHRVGETNPAATAVERTLHLVHEKSKEVKEQLSRAACPVFATSCPFKTLTSAGEPLIQELDVFVDRWGLLDVDSKGLPSSKDTHALQPLVTAPGADTLSKSLKAGTKSVHRAAENVYFVREFLKGAVPLQSYVDFLRDLYHIYAALESGLEALPLELRHCNFEVLRRTQSIAEDLRILSKNIPEGIGNDVVGQPSPAAREYVARIHYVRDHSPILLIAHAYTRYLGDLSGGQILARAASKAYGLAEGEGTAFYRFDDIGTHAADIKAFKKSYRSSLDALQLSGVEADAMVTEASNSFLLNIRIFEERDVAAGHLDRVHSLDEIACLTQLSALKFQQAYASVPGSAEGQKDTGKCPFLPATARNEQVSIPQNVCPWPFIWLHDPRRAVVVHPGKNMAAVMGLGGFAHAAWKYPRTSATCLIAFTAASWWYMPRKVQRHQGQSQA